MAHGLMAHGVHLLVPHLLLVSAGQLFGVLVLGNQMYGVLLLQLRQLHRLLLLPKGDDGQVQVLCCTLMM